MSGSRRVEKSWSRIIGLLLGLLTLVLASGCSAVKLAYNNLPELGYWWIDGYVDLNEAQSVQLRADLARLHEWHRSRELPRIADLLRQLQQLAPADTTPAQVCRLFADARNHFDTALAQAEPGAVALATRLTAAQLQHLEARFAKGNEQWRRDWLAIGPGERTQKRLQLERERAEEFYGTLDDGQRTLLHDALRSSAFDPGKVFAQRLRRQHDLVQTLRTVAQPDETTTGSAAATASATTTGTAAASTASVRASASGAVQSPSASLAVAQPSPAQALAALRAWAERAQHSPDPAYRSYVDAAQLDNCRRLARLHNSTTPEQRRRAVARLAAYERDARELAAQR